MRRRLSRAVLAADGVGCAAAAVLVLSEERMALSFDPSPRSRWPVAAALGATSALLFSGALRELPGNQHLERAAVVNAGWVPACVVGLLGRPSRSGVVVLTATAALDGAAAMAQLALRPEARDHLTEE